MWSLRVGAAAVLAMGVGACGGHARATETPPEQTVSVPAVAGLREADAVRALAESGLIANVRVNEDAPRTGAVRRSTPAAGKAAPESSVVVLDVAPMPRLPIPGPEREQDLDRLGSLVERHPKTFVGLYLYGRGTAVVVFGPRGDPASWSDRLAAAAAGHPYRTERCSRGRRGLRAIQDDVATRDWTANKSLGFGVWVDPSTCTVRVESDLLTEADIRALAHRYGTAISIDTTPGSHPELTRGSGRRRGSHT